MTSVLELQKLAQASSADLLDVVRAAQILAARVGSVEATSWLDAELNGYGKSAPVPPYRVLPTVLISENPLRGNFPVQFEATADNWLYKHFSSLENRQPLGELLALSEAARLSNAPSLSVELSPHELEMVMKSTGTRRASGIGFTRRVDRAALMRVLDGVRSRILKWTLELERSTDPNEPSTHRKVEMTTPNSKKVFVIHGRDDEARRAIFTFLQRLGLEPLEFNQLAHETGSTSPFIGQILDEAFDQAQAVVALFTPDEAVELQPRLNNGVSERGHQPRPNVIFEAGMAFSKMPKRTIIVELGSVRRFTDLDGRHGVRITSANDIAAKAAFVSKLSTAGCDLRGVEHRSDHLNPDVFERFFARPS